MVAEDLIYIWRNPPRNAASIKRQRNSIARRWTSHVVLLWQGSQNRPQVLRWLRAVEYQGLTRKRRHASACTRHQSACLRRSTSKCGFQPERAWQYRRSPRPLPVKPKPISRAWWSLAAPLSRQALSDRNRSGQSGRCFHGAEILCAGRAIVSSGLERVRADTARE